MCLCIFWKHFSLLLLLFYFRNLFELNLCINCGWNISLRLKTPNFYQEFNNTRKLCFCELDRVIETRPFIYLTVVFNKLDNFNFYFFIKKKRSNLIKYQTNQILFKNKSSHIQHLINFDNIMDENFSFSSKLFQFYVHLNSFSALIWFTFFISFCGRFFFWIVSVQTVTSYTCSCQPAIIIMMIKFCWISWKR